MEYEVVIGLEVHAELLTQTKLFCGCSTRFGAPPNSETCPICLGLPGVLPVLNEKAIELAIRAALALNCEIAPFSKFDRKNYFYPDLPKNFQISQYDQPLARNGYLDIRIDGRTKRIRINRVHLEEEAGKLIHIGEKGQIGGSEASLVDFNRTGIPLLEIVSEPDLRAAEEAYAYLIALKNTLQYIEISDCKMEEGSLRCDANTSARSKGQKAFGVKTEVKNMNSFRFVQKALDYEAKRQIKILDEGGHIVQETRLWDSIQGITTSMRTKEYAHDYRYFPEPDLAPLVVEPEWIEEIRSYLPELPLKKKERFIKEYEIPEYDAETLASTKAMANYYEEIVQLFPEPKIVSNWILSELLALMKEDNLEIERCPITPQNFVRMLHLLRQGIISGKIAKTIFSEMYRTGKDADTIVKEKSLVQITDEGILSRLIEKVMQENPKSVEEYRNGKEKALGHLVGQVMKLTQGKANPILVNKLLKEKTHQ